MIKVMKCGVESRSVTLVVNEVWLSRVRILLSLAGTVTMLARTHSTEVEGSQK